MPQTARLHKLNQWLAAGRCVRPAHALDALQVSRSTLQRDIACLRDQFGTPIEWDGDRGGWVLGSAVQRGAAQYELPGLWFSAEEVHALLTMQHLLSHLDAGGFVGHHIEPLMRRLGQILGTGAPPKAEVAKRIRIQTVGARRVRLPHFQAVGTALLRRKRIRLLYHQRARDDRTERDVSPQRLVHYRDNWYLDAWCHWRQALRSFSVDAIEQVNVLDQSAIDVADQELDDVLGAGYGIFSGRNVTWARLRFSPERSRWIAAERWHPRQRGRYDRQGRWELDLPFSDPRELVMDILRHVPDVEVMWPEELRDEVLRRLREGLSRAGGLDE